MKNRYILLIGSLLTIWAHTLKAWDDCNYKEAESLKLEQFLKGAVDGQYNIHFPSLQLFRNSVYPCLDILPDLVSVGMGLPVGTLYASEVLDGLTDITSIFEVAEERYKLGSFLAAVEYAQDIEKGEVHYHKFRYHPTDNWTRPDKPTLYYLAQIELVNIDVMAEILGVKKRTLITVRKRYPDNARLQQLHFFEKVLEQNIHLSWDDVERAYQASAATNHQVDYPAIEVVPVKNSWGTKVKNLKRQINYQFQSIEEQPAEYKYETRRDLRHFHFRPERSQLFAASLGIRPKYLEKENDLSIDDLYLLFTIAFEAIPSLSPLHLAVAAHVTGQLDVLSEYPEFQWYLDKYKHIEVDPIEQPVYYLEVLQRVSDLLSQIQIIQEQEQGHREL